MPLKVPAPTGSALRMLSAAVLIAAASPASAAVLYKDVTTTDINTAANWSTTSGVATPDPVSIATVDQLRFNEFFAPTNGTMYTANLSADLTVGSIRLDSGSGGGGANTGNVTISGAFTLTLMGTGDGSYAGNGIVMNSGTGGTLTINSNIALGAAQTWTTSRALTVNGAINLGASRTLAFNVAGAGNVMTLAGVISGTGTSGLNRTAGPGTLAITNAANTFGGQVTLVGGTTTVVKLANIGENSSLGTGSSTSQIIINGAVLTHTGSNTSTTDRQISINGGNISINNNSSGTLSFTAASIAHAANAARTITLGGSNAGANTFGSVINNSVGFSTGVIKNGAGTWVFSGNNTYSGTTQITAGTFRVGHASALGDTTGGTTISSNSSLDLNGFTIGAEAITSLNGSGISSGGALVNSNTGSAASLAGNITMGLASSVGGAGNLTLSGNIGGAFVLTKIGAGTLTLTGTNTYSSTVVSAGSLVGNTTSLQGAITNNAAVTFNQSTDGSYTAIMSGTGALNKLGTGVVTLSGANSFSGITAITEGTLLLGNVTALGSTAAGTTISSGAVLDLNGLTVGAENITSLSGSGISNGGALINSNTNTNASLSGAITLAANASIGGAGNLTLSNAVSGAFVLSKVGAGTLTLTGSNNFSVDTQISAGTLALGAAGVIADANTVTISGGTFSLGDNNETVTSVSLSSGSITGGTAVLTATSGITSNVGDGVTAILGATTGGSSTLSKQGLGTLSVTKALGHSGGTTVSAGTLSAGGASVLTGDITISGGTLALGANNQSAGAVTLSSGNITGTAQLTGTSFTASNSSAASISAVLAGSGITLSKSGAGILTLSAANTYTGLTSVNEGTLSVTGSIGASAVANGATLRGTGTVGNVTLANGGNLEGGISGSGTLTVGDLEIATSAVANLTINNLSNYTATEALALGNITFNLGSSLVINVTGPFVGGSSYKLLTYDNGSNPFTLGTNVSFNPIGKSSRLTATPDFSTIGEVWYAITGSKVVWTGDGSAPWQTSGSSTAWTASGSATAYLEADDVLFENGGVSSVVLATDVTPGSIEFTATSTDYEFTTANGSKIVGVGSVIKSGTSKVTLSTANTYSGGTTLSAGRIALGDDSALGTGTVTLNGGALSSVGSAARTVTNNLVIGGSVELGNATDNGVLTFQTGTVNLSGATRQITTSSNVTLAGAISNGGITKLGNGILTLSGTNTYEGGVTVSAGRIRAGSASAFGTGTVTLAGGTSLSSDSVSSRILANAFALTGNATLGDATDNGALTLSGAVDLAGNTVTVASNVTFSGSVNAGTLSVSNGTLALGGSNILADTANVTLASGTTFNLGGFADTIGDLTVTNATVSNGTLTAASISASAGTFSANLAGSGALTKTSSGSLLLSGANSSYSGALSVTNGTLLVGSANALGSGTVTLSAGTTLASNSITARALSNNLVLDGNVTLGDSVNTGALTFSSGVALNDANRTVNVLSNVTFGGIISSTNAANGALTKSGAGTLTLSGDNTYTGGTTVSAGTLQLGAANRLADTGAVSLSSGTTFNLGGFTDTVGDVTLDAATISNGTLTASSIAATSSGTISAILAGSGTLTKTGNGTLTLSGANTISGNIAVNGGTLASSTALGTSAISVGANGTLALSRSSTGNALANTLSGSGLITYSGASSELGLTGTSSFSGTITVNSGKLAFENAGSLGGAPILNVASGATASIGSGFSGGTAFITNLTGGGTVNTAWQGVADTRTLSVNSTATSTFSGVLADASGPARVLALTKTGAETLILTGINTYTGATTVSAGTLQIGDGGATGEIRSAATVAISSGATVRVYRSGTIDNIANNRMRSFSGAGNLVFEGTGADKSLIFRNAPGSSTGYAEASSLSGFSGNISIKNGAQYVSARNGSTAFGTGKIILGDATTSGSLAQTQGNWSWTTAIEFVGSDNYIDNQSTGQAPRTLRLMGNLSGAGNVTFRDTVGTMTSADRGFILAGTNTLSGTVTIDTFVRVGGTLAETPVAIDYTSGANGSLGTASVIINSGKTLTFARTDAHEVANLISGSGKIQIGSATALNSSNSPNITGATTSTQVVTLSGANTFTGGTELVQGGLSVSNLSALGSNAGGGNTGYLAIKTTGTFTYTGVTASTSRNLWMDTGAATINVSQAGTTLSFTSTGGTIGGANGNLITKDGAGTLELSGAITSGTSTAVSVANGILRLSGANTYTGATSIGSGATFELAGTGSMAANYSGAISNAGTLAFTGNATHTINSAISGAGAINVAKTGGTLTLGGTSNTFTGAVTVSGGTLTLADATVLAGASSVGVTGGTLNLGGLVVTKAITLNGGDLIGAGSYSGTATILSGSLTRTGAASFGTGIINLNGGTLDLGGFAHANTINLAGGTLANANAFTGNLNATGTNALNGSFGGTFTTSGTLTTTTGLTFTDVLKGTGNIVGNVTVDGATHTPGNSPGVQTIDGNLTYSGGTSIVEWELIGNTADSLQVGTDFDGIVVNGNLDLSIGVALTLIFNSAGSTVDWSDAFWSANRSWTIYDVSGSTIGFSNYSLTDSLASPIDGLMIVNTATDSTGIGLQFVRADAGFYLGQQGSDIRLYYRAVPEPSTYGLILGALALAGAAIRRRKQAK